VISPSLVRSNIDRTFDTISITFMDRISNNTSEGQVIELHADGERARKLREVQLTTAFK
jgi:hypothetical protein